MREVTHVCCEDCEGLFMFSMWDRGQLATNADSTTIFELRNISSCTDVQLTQMKMDAKVSHLNVHFLCHWIYVQTSKPLRFTLGLFFLVL